MILHARVWLRFLGDLWEIPEVRQGVMLALIVAAIVLVLASMVWL